MSIRTSPEEATETQGVSHTPRPQRQWVKAANETQAVWFQGWHSSLLHLLPWSGGRLCPHPTTPESETWVSVSIPHELWGCICACIETNIHGAWTTCQALCQALCQGKDTAWRASRCNPCLLGPGSSRAHRRAYQ